MQLDEARVKRDLIAMWSKGGGDTLVKVMGIGIQPDPARPIGYCTSIKFLIGADPLEMERRVGLRDNTKLRDGAAIYAVRPLPMASQFHYRGHSNTPEGISTTQKAAHRDYPPGKGVPQWEVMGSTQRNLVLLATVRPGEIFRYMLAQLGPVI